MEITVLRDATPCRIVNFIRLLKNLRRPGQLSRYSDSLRAGRSGDRIPVVARFSAPVQTSPGAYPFSCTMGTGSFSGVKRPGRGANPHLHLQCRGLKLGRAIPLPTLRGLVACIGRTFTFTFTLRNLPSLNFRNENNRFLRKVNHVIEPYLIPNVTASQPIRR